MSRVLKKVSSSEGREGDPRFNTRPSSVCQVQRFLGFANFFRRFIRNYSAIAAPLTALTRRGAFKWTPEAELTFEKLKTLLVTAPVLQLPDPDQPFIVEVDASEVGVGAILFQRSGSEKKVHPCANFSHKLTPAERNYPVGNRELLAIKLVFEEWRHWLEGANHQFLVWTDHKNLELIQQVKRLNSRQARWSLFFSRFAFTLSYRLGSKNGKPDALSRQWEISPPDQETEPVIPPSQILAPVTWGIVQTVCDAQRGEPVPEGVPPDRLFVPPRVRS